MFGEFARSAEAVFSRWVIKRVCKFLLKKQLGSFILGDIDLDQLDVQLRHGTVQLSDLALNVDVLNEKLAGAAILVKEGSIASLSIKISWKLKNCQIDVEELELVLAPNVRVETPANADCCMPCHDDRQHLGVDADRLQSGLTQSCTHSTSLDVHEGVKTIAKIVKWLLTSFHVRLKNLILAFDPSSDAQGKKSFLYNRFLVLRIAEAEYGTCVSEDASVPDSKPESLFGIGKLTNFMKIDGATVEFLQMENIDNQPQTLSDLSASFSEWHTGSSPFGCTSTILSGLGGGFSGKVSLTIPWKNGSLDIHKIDADVSLDPVELRLQQSTIKWMIALWESFKNLRSNGRTNVHHGDAESLVPNHELGSQSGSLSSPKQVSHNLTPISRTVPKRFSSTSNQDTITDALLPHANVIHNWVPLSCSQETQVKLELDYGASIDQFFECFDEMRSSQASLGSSGIWNWTCSVFSAITVASNLASGSVHIPNDHQQFETNLQASIGEISVVLSFISEEQKHSHDSSLSSLSTVNADLYMSCLSTLDVSRSSIMETSGTNIEIDHIDARLQHVLLNLQVRHQSMIFEASVMHVKIDGHYDEKSISGGFDFSNYENNSRGHTPLSENLQALVQGALHAFPQHNTKEEASIEASVRTSNASTISQKGLIKFELLESFGVCRLQYAIKSTEIDGKSVSSASFTVSLPPFILWVHLELVTALLNFFEGAQNAFVRSNMPGDSAADISYEKNSSSHDETKTSASTSITSVSHNANTRGKILIPSARVVLCFPTEYRGESTQLASWGNYIVLELSPSPDVGKISDASTASRASNFKGDISTPSTSIHLDIGNIDSYLVTSQSESSLDKDMCSLNSMFTSKQIFSMTNRTNGHPSGISMLWQKGQVTGPWMANRAWSMATSHDRSRRNVTGNGYEYCSVTTAEELEETNSQIRQELILSSAFFVQVHFSEVWVNLGRQDYELLNDLLSNLAGDLADETDGLDINESSQISSDPSLSQVSILVACDVLDLCISLDEIEVSCSIQKELPGSWNCLTLSVEKFELLSVSNIGGITNANFVWMKHGEGELRGSIAGGNKNTPVGIEYLLLIACRNSTMRRGDGEGANALSFGSAGTAITHLKNPQSHQIFTSITVRCGTIVAPGGRMDWATALCLFFTLPPQGNAVAGNDENRSRNANDNAEYKSSFFLELVDAALSYEPHQKQHDVDGAELKTKYGDAGAPVSEAGEKNVACLLAVASFNLSSHSAEASSQNEYEFLLRDVGLLISESSGSKKNGDDYGVDLLRKACYVKVGSVAHVAALLRMRSEAWELECLESNFNLSTCHDTTDGLARLVAQLQRLYAPDVEAALVHLQSRWNSIQRARNEMVEEADTSGNHFVRSCPENNEDKRSAGLLDEILENAFYMNRENGSNFDNCERQLHPQGMHFLGDCCKLNHGTCMVGDDYSCMVHREGSTYMSEMSPQIIDSYYASDFKALSNLSAVSIAQTADMECHYNMTGHKDVECGKGGWYKDGSLMIVENHISKIKQSAGKDHHAENNFEPVFTVLAETCKARGKVLLKNVDVTWRMHAGFDWPQARDDIGCDFRSNGRDRSVCLELMLSGLNLRYDVYPDGQILGSKLSLSVKDFHLYDRSKTAPWKMVLGYYHSKDHPRESCSKAVKLHLEAVKPDPLIPLEEYRLHLEFLPLRLHLDQSQLNFLIEFFGKGASVEESPGLPNELVSSETSIIKMSSNDKAIVEEALLPFFQKCVVEPVVVRVDYIPRHIDLAALRGGNYAELLNLVPWKGIELQLKHVCAAGVYGWNSICETILGEWLEDISHNQVHKLLKGLPPIRSLFAVGSGASKLLALPIKSYKEDHKLLKGMQRGAVAFVRSISLEAVALGVHLAAGAHELLLQTEYFLTSIPPSVPSSERSRKKTTVRPNIPKDAQQGIQQACESISDGFGRTASALVGTPLKAYQRGAGAGPALAAAVRAAPAAAVAPMSASARAVHCVLLGVRNRLDPERKKESMEKYLGPSSS